MAETPPEGNAPALRASDAEREAVAVTLGRNQVEGRLTLDELSQRLDHAYAATTKAELEAVTRDLPAVARPGSATGWIVSVLGGSRRTGRWRAAGRLRILAVLGGCDIDLSHAVVTTPEVTLTCLAFLGGIDIVVPRGVDAELTGFSLIGGRDLDVSGEPSRPGTPRIRVRAFSLLGGINVHNPPIPRT